MIEKLDWDSSFFGYNIGKINIQNNDTFDFREFKSECKNFKLVYVFSDQTIDNSELLLVDKKIVFHQYINANIDVQSEYKSEIIFESFDVGKHSLEMLKDLSLQSGIYSRFFVDKNFKNNEYEKLYLKWIENSVDKIISFDIIVALKDNKILGFATLNKKDENLVDIGLVAVSESYRGLGIGKKIINESIMRSKKIGFNEIQVVTQLNNSPANNLYKSTKFEIQNITNIYHFWNI